MKLPAIVRAFYFSRPLARAVSVVCRPNGMKRSMNGSYTMKSCNTLRIELQWSKIFVWQKNRGSTACKG
jgi:hypothetical protein